MRWQTIVMILFSTFLTAGEAYAGNHLGPDMLTGNHIWIITLVIMFIMMLQGSVPFVAFVAMLVAFFLIYPPDLGDLSWLLEGALAVGVIVIVIGLLIWAVRKLRYSMPLGSLTSGLGGGRRLRTSAQSSSPIQSSTPTSNQMASNVQVTKTLYHGTPTLQNARNIAQGTGTWKVGNGNVYGTGVYLADKSTARAYAGTGGGMVKVQLSAPSSQIADYYQVTTSNGFRTWKLSNGNGNHGDEVAHYVTEELGKRFIQVNQNMFVGLVSANLKSVPVEFQGLTAIEARDLAGNIIN